MVFLEVFKSKLHSINIQGTSLNWKEIDCNECAFAGSCLFLSALKLLFSVVSFTRVSPILPYLMFISVQRDVDKSGVSAVFPVKSLYARFWIKLYGPRSENLTAFPSLGITKWSNAPRIASRTLFVFNSPNWNFHISPHCWQRLLEDLSSFSRIVYQAQFVQI